MSHRHDRQVLVMALVLVSASGIAAVDRTSSTAQDTLGRIMAPVQGTLHALGKQVNVTARGARDAAQLRATVGSLEEENARLEVENLKTVDLMTENQRLRELLGFAQLRVDLDLRGASVVGRRVAEEPGNLVRTVKVSVGERQGVRTGMPVASDRGLVGRVVRTGSSWSDVLLMNDPRSAVQARVERSRATGVVFGTPSGELRLRFVPQDRGGEPNVREGDVIFTSGLSEEFPPMIPIGQVVEVRQRDVETHQEAVIRPSENLNDLEFVLVIAGSAPAEAAHEGP